MGDGDFYIFLVLTLICKEEQEHEKIILLEMIIITQGPGTI